MPTNACPRDGDRALTPFSRMQETMTCGQCHGLWLPGTVVAGVVGHLPAVKAQPPADSHLHCPDDHAALRAIRHRGVEIDVCPDCGGVWLDNGELALILGKNDQDTNESPAADALETTLELLPLRNQSPHIRPEPGECKSPLSDLTSASDAGTLDALGDLLSASADGAGDALSAILEFVGDALSGF